MECNAPLRGLPFSTKQALQLDTYYEHANNTGPHPNHQVNAAGLIIDVYSLPEVQKRR
jgi:hypothetical protein